MIKNAIIAGFVLMLILGAFFGESEKLKKQKEECERYAYNASPANTPVGCYEYFKITVYSK